MTVPIELDIPHKMGRAAMRERLDGRIGQITSGIPGGGTVEHRWEGDMMHVTVAAVGQAIACRLTVFDDKVHAVVALPPFLAMFSGQLKEMIEREAPKLLR